MYITRKLFTSRRLAYLLIAAGLVTGGVSVLLLVHQERTEPKPPVGAITSTAAPSAKRPSPAKVASYTVPPFNPKYISISSIGIGNTPILALGKLASGAIATPNTIYETGWYAGSSRPGQSGAMFIYGHVSSWTADGIFYNLKKLKPGDKVTIVRGDNALYSYQVVSSKIYPYNNVNMNQVLSPITAGTPGLNLMTCTGSVMKGTSEFNERLVVYTSLVHA
jgi:sortase A